MMYRKYNFLNVRFSVLTQLLVVCCIMLIFLLNYFDKEYIKLCTILTIISVLADLVWLFIYGAVFWTPPEVGEYYSTEKDYLRIIVLFTILTLSLKV